MVMIDKKSVKYSAITHRRVEILLVGIPRIAGDDPAYSMASERNWFGIYLL